MKNLLRTLPEEELDHIDLFGINISNQTTKEGKVYRATTHIQINNEAIPTKHPIDFFQLVESLKASGNYYIFTCGCGSAGCAGIEDGVEVEHHNNIIEWRCRLPQSMDGFDSYEAWLAGSELHHAVFEQDQIKAEVYRALDEMRNTHNKDTEYSPYGFERSAIIQLLKGFGSTSSPNQ